MPKSSTSSSSNDEKRIDELKDKMSKKHSRTSTIPMVNRDAVEILEEFLKKRQHSLKDVTPMHSLYQKVSELEVNEEKQSFQRSQSYRAASHESLLSNEDEIFQQTVVEEILTPTAPLASDEDSDSHAESPVSAPEATYYKRKSSADSSSSDSSEWAADKRHKKSFFKRARERLRITLKIQKKNKKEREEKEKKHSHKKKRKKGKKKDKDGKVLSEVTTVTKTHIRQSCTISDIPSHQSEVTLRQGDVWESKDIKDKSGIFKHVKTHLKIKESTDSNASNGFAGSFKKLKSLHRNGRKTLSLGRKDKDMDGARKQIYRRSYSDSNEKCIHVTKEESKEDEKSLTTKVFNEVISMQGGGSGDNCCQKESAKERDHLHLDINPVFTSELPTTGSFEFESEHHEIVTTIQTPDGITHRDRVIEHHEYLSDQVETEQIEGAAVENEDTVDGAVGGASDVDDDTKREMYKRVASKLAIMADEYLCSDSEGTCSTSELQMAENSELTPLEREIVEHLLSIRGNTTFPSTAAMEILKHLTYNNFKQIVEGYTKDKRGVQELAALFMLSKFAINIVGAGRALASQVKDLTLQYFEDKLAAYIVERGGWDSVLEDTDEDTESKDSEQK